MAAQTTDKDKTVKSENIFGQPLTIFGVPVDRETIFNNHKGDYKPKVEKRQRNLIVKSTSIKFYLHDGETIQCLTSTYSPISILEQALTGPSFLLFKKALLIFTNKRILHIPTRFKRSPRGSASQILFEDCARLEVKGRGLHVQYKNGQQETFPYIHRKEKKKIRTLLTQLSLSPKDAGRLKGRVYLCPRCTTILTQPNQPCTSCQLRFKTPVQAELSATAIPGGAYFYTRYPIMGTLTALLELSLAVFILMQWLMFQKGQDIVIWHSTLALTALMSIKALSAYHCAQLVKDFIPRRKNFTKEKK